MQGHTQRIDTVPDKSGPTASCPSSIGKYEILEPIGEGGFGMVYKGFDPFIKRFVAIKTCTSPDQELRQRYYREAEIAGRLDHPNIVRIFDFGTENDTPFLVQEFLAGGDLDHKIEGQQFVPVPERLLYLIHIARGLAYAHEQGVIHRDIKPANIRILEDGSAKIMDFGVAMLQNTETRLTKDGMAVGTAAYLAPEQVKGGTADHRSDIFSYGVLAYELLTSQRPFERETISATLFSILHDDAKPITLPPHICPASLRRLIELCMEKDPELRPTSFDEILEDLDRIRADMRSCPSDRDFSSELRNVSPQSDSAQRSGSFDPPIQQEWAPPSIRMQRRRSWLRTLVPAALLAAVATGVGVLAGQGLLPWFDGPTTKGTLSAPVAALSPDNLSVRQTESEKEPVAEPAPEATNAAVTESADLAVETVAEPEPPPPPVIEKSTLFLNKGWHSAITASIDGGDSMALSRTRSRQLEPGDHVVRYSLVTPEYSASQTVRVQTAAGEERWLNNPIARPGQLSVQANLGSPQGIVSINGRSLGTSPVRGVLLSPGRHQLQVASVNDPSLPLSEATVDIRIQRETVITFDLTGQRELVVRYRENSP